MYSLRRFIHLLNYYHQIATNGWTHADPWKATKEVIAPVTGGLLGMICLPAAVLWGLRQLGTTPMDGKFICEPNHNNLDTC